MAIKRKRLIQLGALFCVAFVFCPLSGAQRDIKTVVTRSDAPTDLEGKLKNKTAFYFIKFNYRSNFFSFNVPAHLYENLPEAQREELIDGLLTLYDGAFKVFEDVFGYMVKGYRFNCVFGPTRSGFSFNKIYLATKVSSIFTNFLPYKNDETLMAPDQRRVMLHEIGHGLFGIAVGNLEDIRFRAVEEGFTDYVAQKFFGEEHKRQIKIPLTPARAGMLKGLTQLDVDVGLWPEKLVFATRAAEGYIGMTHHAFGIEFINVFVDMFGQARLAEFLKRLKAAESRESEGDFGTAIIRNIFAKMNYPESKVMEFEDMLKKRLLENVFEIAAKFLEPTARLAYNKLL